MSKISKNKDHFLLDVHTEPLPSRFVDPAVQQLKLGAEQKLRGIIEYQDIFVYGTLRHLILYITNVAASSKTQVMKFKGPKSAAAKNEEGQFTPAAEGFARKHGLKASELIVEDGIYYAEVKSPGQPAVKLFQKIVPELLHSMQFPKAMTWENSGFRFGRPLRALTILYGNKVVPLELAGIKSTNLCYGHPSITLAANRLKVASDPIKNMKKGHIILQRTQRQDLLIKTIAEQVKTISGQADLDNNLIEETVNMVEYPTAILGHYNPDYGQLPTELLKVVMKKQLKFFPALDKQGKLLPAFIGIRDGLPKRNSLVKEGYQRVLEARLNDASFFYKRDCSQKLSSRLNLLERVTYQKALGSMAQKAARVETLSQWMTSHLRQLAPVDEQVVIEAAPLVYADLVTEVVKEFPELQGAMGGIYARHDGLNEKTALCLEQFYYPIAAKTPVPTIPEACIISVAGKLDSLAGCFTAGLLPSGSADPFALRRQALGIVRILLERQLPLDLELAIQQAVDLQPIAIKDAQYLREQLREFIWNRAVSLFEEMGFRADEIRAISSEALKDISTAFRRLAAIRSVRRDPSFASLAAAFKRASNILKQSQESDLGVSADRKLMSEEVETSLYDLLVKVEGESNDKIVRGDFEGALKSLVAIKPNLDSFFENVMIMVEEVQVRRQRLAVLSKLVRAFKRVADLSEIQ